MLDLFAYEDVEQKIRSNKVFPFIKPPPNFSTVIHSSVRTKKNEGNYRGKTLHQVTSISTT